MIFVGTSFSSPRILDPFYQILVDEFFNSFAIHYRKSSVCSRYNFHRCQNEYIHLFLFHRPVDVEYAQTLSELHTNKIKVNFKALNSAYKDEAYCDIE